jgi:hypothetical protein
MKDEAKAGIVGISPAAAPAAVNHWQNPRQIILSRGTCKDNMDRV